MNEARFADEIRERVRGPPEQLLEGGDDTEGLIAAGQDDDMSRPNILDCNPEKS